MSSLSAVGRSAAVRKVDRSAVTHKNDRVSLCSFTFADGRRCRTPRAAKHPHFCFYHAQKEARSRAAETLGKDLAYFFSGDYLSACDLSTALARLIPAVLRGDVKPKAARTVAYLAQTLLQAIHISEQEYINAFSTDDWRKSIRNSVHGNYEYRFPPAPKPAKPQSPQPQPQPAQPHQPVSQPAKTPVAPPAQPNNPLIRPTHSSTGGHHSHQEPSEPQPPVAAAPSAARQEPRPTAGPQTGPSGLPVLAPLPPRNPGGPPSSRSS